MKMSFGRKLPMLVVDETIPVGGEKFVLVLQRKMSCCFPFAEKVNIHALVICWKLFSVAVTFAYHRPVLVDSNFWQML